MMRLPMLMVRQRKHCHQPSVEKVETGIQQLANQYVEAHEHAEQQPAFDCTAG